MRYLYVDNFRGFKNTLIPIKKASFLVGENSTGKTSILSLLNVLSSLQFWLRQEFNTEQMELGNFKNIVSMESSDSSYFRIGFFLDEIPSKGKEKSPILILITFVENNDLPVLSQYNYLDNEAEFVILFSEKSIKYRKNPIKITPDDYSYNGLLQRIEKWKKENGRKGYKTHKLPDLPGKNDTLSASLYLVGIKYAKELSPTQFRFFKDFSWIAPIRSKPRRTYDQLKYDFSPEGEHAPYLIRKLLTDPKVSGHFRAFIENFGEKSNLLDSVEINEFGTDSSSPFELKVRLDGKPININYVGYGVSQCLPLLVDMFSKNAGTWFAIQQPEVHLHPKAQAALGDLFYRLAIYENKYFLVETHSDYIIDRFRLNYRRGTGKKIDAQVLYFERTKEGNTVYPIDIDTDGRYSENLPESFRDFFIKEQLDLLQLD